MRKKELLRIAAVIAVVAVVVLLSLLAWSYGGGFFTNLDSFRTRVQSYGPWAPVVFAALQILQVVVFVIPGEIPQIAGGYLFGIVPGFAYSAVGIALGSLINFLLARYLGKPFVSWVIGKKRTEDMAAWVGSDHVILGFFIVFLTPGVPKDILCYIAGLSSLAFLPFLLFSMVGRLPGLIGSVIIGNGAAYGQWTLVVILGAASVLMMGLALIFRRRLLAWVKARTSESSRR